MSIVDLVLNGSGCDVIAHRRLMLMIFDWRQRGLPVIIGQVHAASSGCMMAVLLISAVTLGWSRDHVHALLQDFVHLRQQHGMRRMLSHVLPVVFDQLPHDVHEMMSGVLHVYYHDLRLCAKKCVSEFPTKQSLLTAISHSATIPLITHNLLSRYVDGCLVPPLTLRPGTFQLISGPEKIQYVFSFPADISDHLPSIQVPVPEIGTRLYVSRPSLLTRVLVLLYRLVEWVISRAKFPLISIWASLR
jgi:hypothetical protein